VLHRISPSIVDHDIHVFLDCTLRLIGQERSLDACWPDEQIIKLLVQCANGLFIWAATACRFIREGKQLATKRIAKIIDSKDEIYAPEKYLYKLYTTVLEESMPLDTSTDEQEEVCAALRLILGSIVVVISPLSVHSLGRLLHTSKEDVYQTLGDLQAILDIPEDHVQPIRLHHPSFVTSFLIRIGAATPNYG
jgi:hypothetical protein